MDSLGEMVSEHCHWGVVMNFFVGGLLLISSFGVALALRPQWDVYELRDDEMVEYTFDVIYYLLIVGVAAVFATSGAVLKRGGLFYGKRVVPMVIILILAQWFGQAWHVMDRHLPFRHPDRPKAENWSDALALSLGFLGAWAMACTLFPVSRASPLMACLGIPLDACLRAHAILGRCTVCFLVLHMIGFIISWWTSDDGDWAKVKEKLTEWPDDDVNVLAGVIGLSSLIVGLFLFSLSILRRKLYEVFYRFHILGLLGFVTFGCMHWHGLARYLAAPITLWVADLARRCLDASTDVRIVSTAYERANLVHLTITPGTPLISAALHTDPACGVFLSLQIPKISNLQFHAFSCYPLTEDHRSYDCWIRALGGWTCNLIMEPSPMKGRLHSISAAGWPGRRGSTGKTTNPLLLIVGGTGMVPLLGLLRSGTTGSMTVVWAIRYLEDVYMLKSLQRGDFHTDMEAPRDMHLKIYYTGSAGVGAVQAALDEPADAAVVSNPGGSRQFSLFVIAGLHFVAFAGAIFGMHWAEELREEYDKMDEWKDGLQLLVNIVYFATLPAFLFAAAVALYMRWVALKGGPDVAKTRSAGKGGGGRKAWTSTEVVAGRPDLEAHMDTLEAQEGSKLVMVAGPGGLVNAAHHACKGITGLRRPSVSFDAVTYSVADL